MILYLLYINEFKFTYKYPSFKTKIQIISNAHGLHVRFNAAHGFKLSRQIILLQPEHVKTLLKKKVS
jgi:hypothetical protein